MKIFTKKPCQAGMTLIEIMIALVLGLILLIGVSQIFVTSKNTYRLNEGQARLQENARIAFEYLTRDIREAGYSGCRSLTQMNVQSVASAPIPTFSEATAITGHEATGVSTWSPALSLPAAVASTVISGTDVVTIQKGTHCGGTLTGNLGSSNANVQIFAPNSCNISAGDALMVSDCEDAHIFRATNAPPSGGSSQTVAHSTSENTSNHFCINQTFGSPGSCGSGNAKLYDSNAEILQFKSLTYFIRLGAGGRNALWVYDNAQPAGTNNPIELIESVADLQVQYGVDTSANQIIDSYETADTVDTAGDWDKVISSEVNLLLETQEDHLTTVNQTYIFNGATVTAADNRLRRTYTTIIGLRNRVQ